jgi:hypothetical protein
MERYLFAESNGVRRKFFQMGNFRNFRSKNGPNWKYSDAKALFSVAIGIISRFAARISGGFQAIRHR